MKLFFRAECIKDMIAVMELLGFAFIWIIFGRQVPNQTLVASDMLDVILISTGWFFQ